VSRRNHFQHEENLEKRGFWSFRKVGILPFRATSGRARERRTKEGSGLKDSQITREVGSPNTGRRNPRVRVHSMKNTKFPRKDTFHEKKKHKRRNAKRKDTVKPGGVEVRNQKASQKNKQPPGQPQPGGNGVGEKGKIQGKQGLIKSC